jgi:Flp pilus assembly protein TadD
VRYLTAAVALRPNSPGVHLNLGTALWKGGQLDEAIACYQKAIALDAKYAPAHNNLGLALQRAGKVDEAIACFREALALVPTYARAHNNLGAALGRKGKVDEPIACFREALALAPKLAPAHNNLGLALEGTGKVDQAIACFRKAIELVPAEAEAHCNLGHALLVRGDFAEALAPLKRGHELGGKRDGGKYRAALWVGICQQLINQEKRLLDILAGKSAPANPRERLEWIRLCGQTRRYAGVARLWGEAFGADASLANDLQTGYRYQAATAAAQAAAGKGRDAGGLGDGQKADLRKLALGWLKADLAARANRPAAERVEVLRRWLADEALAGVRGEQALRALPRAERASWVDFWSEVQRCLLAEGCP